MYHQPFRNNSFHHQRKHAPDFHEDPHADQERVSLEQTGKESEYLRSLMDSHKKVTVKMTDGETFQGHIRYYDQDCFSIGLTASGPRIFLRKANVSYILEE